MATCEPVKMCEKKKLLRKSGPWCAFQMCLNSIPNVKQSELVMTVYVC